VPTLLAEVLRAKPDLLVTSMLPPTSRIDPAQCVPILAVAVWEPYGFVPHLPCRAHVPGCLRQDVSATHLRLARAAVPAASRFAVLTDSDRPFLSST